MSRIEAYCRNHIDLLVFIISSCISICSLLYFYLHGNLNIADYDAIARLNIARKVVDSLTPGVGQLGGVWLPFPQVLMIPFIWNDFLWHSGLAGSIISGIAFIIGAVFLRKTVLLITESSKVSLFVWAMFVGNVNILLLQSMPMSESFFLCFFILVLYYLTKWVQGHDIADFLSAAISLLIITLTRYEGDFILVGAVIAVLIECLLAYRKAGKKKIEGMLLLFLTVSGFGVILWCLYSALFYKDPFYWLQLYSAGKSQVQVASHVTIVHTMANASSQIPLLKSVKIYTEAIAWTTGLITMFLGIFGFISVIYFSLKRLEKIQNIRLYIPLITISAVLFIFLVYGYSRKFIPEISIPPKLLPEMLRKSFTAYTDSDLRYGIIMAPVFMVFAGILSARSKLLYIIMVILLEIQFVFGIYSIQVFQYIFPSMWQYKTLEPIPWFKSHYDGGIILMSAKTHEDFMFQTGLPYKDFIYEGSREYWLGSLSDPAKYARWVIYDQAIGNDSIYKYLTPEARSIVKNRYTLVYSSRGFTIYRIID